MFREFLSGETGGVSLIDFVAIGFLVIFGANLGSFLNVVAYRVPRGRSVVFGGSRCPVCRKPIRPWHNLPVVGWLLLGGRCRDCLVAIPFRYPLVEVLAAVVIGSVAAVELLSGGRNLPAGNAVASGPWWRGVDQLLLRPNGRLVAICSLHVTGVATLLAWALIERDRQRLPPGWWMATLLGLLSLLLAFPWLQPARLTFFAAEPGAPLPLPEWQAAGLVGLVGMLTGWLVGTLLRNLRLGSRLAPPAMALIGGLCGWQATLATAVIWFAVSVVRTGTRRVLTAAAGTSLPNLDDEWLEPPRLLLADLVAAFAIELIAWRWLDQSINGLLESLAFRTVAG